jgi:hypothetical protein
MPAITLDALNIAVAAVPSARSRTTRALVGDDGDDLMAAGDVDGDFVVDGAGQHPGYRAEVIYSTR